MLIVNVASRCGFTPQYAGLEALYRKFADRGLVVLGFPCNQFGAQEPGSEKEIASFCSANYDVTFPMFAKIDVNGESAHPLYRLLKREAPGILGSEAIKWNFTKFLVDREGHVVKRYASTDTPEQIAGGRGGAAVTAIDARVIDDGDPLVLDVKVHEGAGETQHRVTLSRKDFERLSGGAEAERLIDAAFRFLLDREAKESILARFDVSVDRALFPGVRAEAAALSRAEGRCHSRASRQ